ncbi:MAG: Na+/H+ antiporter NhaA [Microbacteriaceae bacterium]
MVSLQLVRRSPDPEDPDAFIPESRRSLVDVVSAIGTARIGAALLLIAALTAIVWENIPGSTSYVDFWESTIALRVGSMEFEMSFRHLVNDGLMAIFFFTVGLEVRREFALGELANRSRAIVPVAAAVAGLIIPALIFVAFTLDSGAAHAWGIVISTDTAFLVGALALLGKRVPGRLRIFLLTLAVVDDIGALSIIAIVYTDDLQWVPLALAAVGLAAVALTRYLRWGRGPIYGILAIATWMAFFASGVHPTLAGVAIALLVPVFPPQRRQVEHALEVAQVFRQSPNSEYARAAANSLRESISINDRLQTAYAPYVAYVILPLFALANAGVALDGEMLAAAAVSPITWGVVAGLVVGKFVGIFGASTLMKRFGIGEFGPGLTLDRIAGGAILTGIGFTISLFIVDLAFDDAVQQNQARVGVLLATVIAFALGTVALRVAHRMRPVRPPGESLARAVDPVRDHIYGDPDSELTLVEYGDFQCFFCLRASGSIDVVREHFGHELRYVWRHAPLPRFHPNAVAAAEASEAAAKQGAFVEFGRSLFADQDNLRPDDILGRAEQLGLDMDRFEADLRSSHVRARVRDDMLDAEVMDIAAVPTFFIGGRRHTGPHDAPSLIAAIEASRGRPTAGAPSADAPEDDEPAEASPTPTGLTGATSPDGDPDGLAPDTCRV